MKCQRCQKKEATIMIRQVINGKEQEYKLCQDCAQEMGFGNGLGFDFDNFLTSGFFPSQIFAAMNPQNPSGSGYNLGVFVPGKQETKTCRFCNTTLDDIQQKGRLGCSHCYETFEEQLGQIFRRIQSGDKHRGRKIAETKEKGEIFKLYDMNEVLQQKIKEAVDKEDYESAAKWKTEIAVNKERIAELEKISGKEVLQSKKEKPEGKPAIHEIDLSGENTATGKPEKKPGKNKNGKKPSSEDQNKNGGETPGDSDKKDDNDPGGQPEDRKGGKGK